MNPRACRLYHIRSNTYRHFWRSLWFHSSAHVEIEPLRPGLAQQHFPPQVPAPPKVSPLLTENKVQRQAGAQQGLKHAFWPFLPTGADWLNLKGGLQSRLKGKPRLSSPAIGRSPVSQPLALLCHCLSLFANISGSSSLGVFFPGAPSPVVQDQQDLKSIYSIMSVFWQKRKKNKKKRMEVAFLSRVSYLELNSHLTLKYTKMQLEEQKLQNIPSLSLCASVQAVVVLTEQLAVENFKWCLRSAAWSWNTDACAICHF